MPACPMSVLYADHRALASGMAKQKVLDTLVKALSSIPGASDVLAGAAVDAASLTWAEVAMSASQLETPVLPKPLAPTSTTTTALAEEVPVSTTKRKRLRVDKRPSHKDRAS